MAKQAFLLDCSENLKKVVISKNLQEFNYGYNLLGP